MRRLKLLIILFIPFIFVNTVYASTTTYPRDENNLGVSSDIVVTNDNLPFILNTPKVNASEKVYDFADLFTTGEEQILYNLAMNFINKTSYDLVIVTIDDNPKSYWHGQNPTSVYADDFYDYNDFKNDGLLLLIDMENKEYFVSTSGEAILMYDDNRIDSILDSMEYQMKNGAYYSAMNNGINKISSYYDSGIPSSNSNCKITDDGEYVCYKSIPYFAIAIISGIITAIIMVIITRRYKKIRTASNADQYIDDAKSKIIESKDQFLYSNTVKVRKQSSSSSGGSSGGSSTRSSSSGRSHGGGGRGF